MTTTIERTDETWNPVVGCSKVSEGCRNCYAESVDRRFAGRFGHEHKPWTAANAACTLPEYIKQAVRKAERKGMKK